MTLLRLSLCAAALGAGPLAAEPPTDAKTTSTVRTPGVRLPVSLDDAPRAVREAVIEVIDKAVVSARTDPDDFTASPAFYEWLLDHPDRVSLAWRRLKIGAVDIEAKADGKFSWADGNGGELVWSTVAKGKEGRIWFAEGKVKAGTVVPSVPVRAVAVVKHSYSKTDADKPRVRHRAEVYLHTDSKMANLVMKTLGAKGPQMAEQGADQMLYFFSGVARYSYNHPDEAPTLLAEKK